MITAGLVDGIVRRAGLPWRIPGVSCAVRPVRLGSEAPRQGCPFFSPDVEGRSPEDSGLRWGSIPATPLGCRTDCLTGKCDTLAGSCMLKSVFFPGVFATSWLDRRAIYVNHQTFGVEILCGLILLSYFEVVVGII